MIKGIDVILLESVQVGFDDFNNPIYETKDGVIVHDVLVAPATSEEVINELNLSGKHIVYNLAIPKGDTHKWEDATVIFFDRVWRVATIPTEGIESMIPLRWNKKVQVEAYE